MEYLRKVKVESKRIKWITDICLLLVFVIGLSYIGLEYYRPFHIGVEMFNAFIALGVFIIAINSYEISKNIPFLFLGVGYGSAGVFLIIHIILSNGMGFFNGDTNNIALIFSTISRFIIAVSTLICFRLLYKSYKKINCYTIVFGFTVLSVGILLLVFFYDKFPHFYVPEHGLTNFKILIECVISVILLINIVVVFKVKKYIEPNAFLFLNLYLYVALISNILLNFYTVQEEITNVLAHILRLISFYFIYRVIVKVSLKAPYKLLSNELNNKNNSLKLKDSELNQTVYKLKKENKLRKNLEEIFLKNDSLL